jgi:integrase
VAGWKADSEGRCQSRTKSGRQEFFDTHLPGFGLRIAESGHKAWVVFYRIGGKQRRYTIGTLATHPKVDQARERAREILRDVERGVDPTVAKAIPTLKAETVETLAALFIERYAKPKNRSWQGTERTLALHVLPRWGSRDAAAITRRDVLALMDALVDGGLPVGANRVLAAIRKMFGWAVERDILPTSPAVNVRAPGKEVERDRVLSDRELTKIWRAAEIIGGIPGGFFKTLILTAQRRDEVATMRWSDLDLQARVWTLPRKSTKGDRSHEVPLTSLAVEVLTALPRTGDYVFSRIRPGKAGAEAETQPTQRPISGYSRMKATIAKAAGFNDWRIHDFRRTAGTGMARLGIAVSTISRVLNHKEGGITKIYNRYSYLDEKRHALDIWAEKLEGLTGKPGLAAVAAETEG